MEKGKTTKWRQLTSWRMCICFMPWSAKLFFGKVLTLFYIFYYLHTYSSKGASVGFCRKSVSFFKSKSLVKFSFLFNHQHVLSLRVDKLPPHFIYTMKYFHTVRKTRIKQKFQRLRTAYCHYEQCSGDTSAYYARGSRFEYQIRHEYVSGFFHTSFTTSFTTSKGNMSFLWCSVEKCFKSGKVFKHNVCSCHIGF